jgi:tetratricopeptide (TPR) repeat protein
MGVRVTGSKFKGVLKVLFLKFLFLIFTILLISSLAMADSAQQLLASGRVDDAIAMLTAKTKANPSDAESYNLLCRSYLLLGNWDPGISACEKAVSLQPYNSGYHLWLGRIYGEKADKSNFLVASGLAGKVRTEFEKAVQLQPDNVAARSDLAEFYLEAPGIVGGGRDKAEAQASTMAALDPAKAHWVLGRIAEKNHNPAEAEKQYRAAVDGSYGSALAWLNLAFFFRRAQRFDQMEDAINHAASVQSNQPEVLMEGAATLILTGRDFPAAVQLLHRYLNGSMVEEAPAFQAHYLLGTVLEKQGETQAAAQEYRAALAMARSFSRAQEALDRLNR